MYNSLNDFPEDILREIFKWLDLESIDTTMLVCKKWYNSVQQNLFQKHYLHTQSTTFFRKNLNQFDTFNILTLKLKKNLSEIRENLAKILVIDILDIAALKQKESIINFFLDKYYPKENTQAESAFDIRQYSDEMQLNINSITAILDKLLLKSETAGSKVFWNLLKDILINDLRTINKIKQLTNSSTMLEKQKAFYDIKTKEELTFKNRITSDKKINDIDKKTNYSNSKWLHIGMGTSFGFLFLVSAVLLISSISLTPNIPENPSIEQEKEFDKKLHDAQMMLKFAIGFLVSGGGIGILWGVLGFISCYFNRKQNEAFEQLLEPLLIEEIQENGYGATTNNLNPNLNLNTAEDELDQEINNDTDIESGKEDNLIRKPR